MITNNCRQPLGTLLFLSTFDALCVIICTTMQGASNKKKFESTFNVLLPLTTCQLLARYNYVPKTFSYIRTLYGNTPVSNRVSKRISCYLHTKGVIMFTELLPCSMNLEAKTQKRLCYRLYYCKTN